MRRSIRHHRSLFLSDLHLGAIGGRSDLILAFLQQNSAETYYLVGDVLDLWQPLLPHWTGDDQRVIDHLRDCQAQGARLHYLRGNHDPDPLAALRAQGLDLPVEDARVHLCPDGRRFLVLHGDVVDRRIFRAHAMTRLGSRIDHALRSLDRLLSRMRRSSPEARSAIEMLLAWVNALAYRGRRHEEKLVAMARAQGLDGVICGHFHMAELHDRHGLTYANCGDWMDSMTGLAEGQDGSLRLVAAWHAEKSQPQSLPPLPTELAR